MNGLHVQVRGGVLSTDTSLEKLADEAGIYAAFDGYFRPVGANAPYDSAAESFLRWYQNEGIEGVLEGSYCGVVYDSHKETVTLFSDRFGTRPLYYQAAPGGMTISTKLMDFAGIVERLEVPKESLSESRALGFVRAPHTLISDVRRVPKNACITINLADLSEQLFRLPNFLANRQPKNGEFNALKGSVRECLEHECSLLARKADSAAILLSGGVDSSILAAVASRYFNRCVAFSCDMEGFGNPELERARYVAGNLGMEHRIVELKCSDIPRLFERMANLIEGPSRHINNIVTLRLFEDIRGFDVVIGGDGADALFGSGNQKTVANIDRKLVYLQRVPASVRSILAASLRLVPHQKSAQLQRLLTKDLKWLTDRLFTIEYSESEERLANKWRLPPFSGSEGRLEQSDTPIAKSIETNFELFLNSMLMRNSQLSSNMDSYLYYPFLTESMLKISKQVPDNLRFDEQGNAKPVLRAVCDSLLGNTVTQWPKIGFVSPEKAWLDNELSGFVERLFLNNGGITRVLGWRLQPKDIQVLRKSTRLLWWLITLDESLLQFADRHGMEPEGQGLRAPAYGANREITL